MDKVETVFLSRSEQETQSIACALASEIKGGNVFCFRGDLGMGKSVFCRALIRALCGNADLEVPSPTFTLVQIYDGPDFPLWHFDLYRLGDPSEIYEIGWEEALSDGVVLVEWPERLGSLLPSRYTDVRISSVSDHPNHREIKIIKYDDA